MKLMKRNKIIKIVILLFLIIVLFITIQQPKFRVYIGELILNSFNYEGLPWNKEKAKIRVKPSVKLPEWVVDQCNYIKNQRIGEPYIHRCDIDLFEVVEPGHSTGETSTYVNYNNDILASGCGRGYNEKQCSYYDKKCVDDEIICSTYPDIDYYPSENN